LQKPSPVLTCLPPCPDRVKPLPRTRLLPWVMAQNATALVWSAELRSARRDASGRDVPRQSDPEQALMISSLNGTYERAVTGDSLRRRFEHSDAAELI
jgi:hypothetical protein